MEASGANLSSSIVFTHPKYPRNIFLTSVNWPENTHFGVTFENWQKLTGPPLILPKMANFRLFGSHCSKMQMFGERSMRWACSTTRITPNYVFYSSTQDATQKWVFESPNSQNRQNLDPRFWVLKGVNPQQKWSKNHFFQTFSRKSVLGVFHAQMSVFDHPRVVFCLHWRAFAEKGSFLAHFDYFSSNAP